MSATSIGATAEERRRALPGDALLKEAIGTWTHGVTIAAPPQTVWPWLAQMGAGRAGWYSWDFLDNGGRSSANEIVPEWQGIAAGDVLPAVPGATDAFVVERVEAGRDIVLTVPHERGGLRATWEFVLEPLPGERTRLLVRGRVGSQWLEGVATRPRVPVEYAYRVVSRMPRRLMLAAAGAGHRVMEARQLRGIRRRAEASRRRTIDRFMPQRDVRERAEALVQAPAELAFEVARGLDLQSIPLVHAIFWARGTLLGSQTTSAPRRPKGIVEECIGLGWGVLAERPGREIVMGAFTRPWEPDVVFTSLPSDGFASFADAGVVKIAWTIEAEPTGPARTRIATETRALATDEHARRRFRRYWRRFGPGIVLIRRLILARVRREAERRHRAASSRPPSAPVERG